MVTLRIPPLRERQADIPLLVDYYLAQFCQEHGKPVKRVLPEALRGCAATRGRATCASCATFSSRWSIFHQGDEVQARDLPPELRGGVPASLFGPVAAAPSPVSTTPAAPRTMDEIERQAILAMLDRTGGRRAEAAQALGIGLRTLQRKLKDYKAQGYFSE